MSRQRGMIMEKPIISSNYTIEDIHKIREHNYEVTKNMTLEEKLAYYNTAGMEIEKEIQRRKALKRKNAVNV